MSFGQQENEIEQQYFEGKAKNCAVIAAKYATHAYHYAKDIYFGRDMGLVSIKGDSSQYFTLKALEFSNKAIEFASDTNVTAIAYMNMAIAYLHLTDSNLVLVMSTSEPREVMKHSELSMYAAGNAIVDAYNASLYFYDGEKDTTKTEPSEETARNVKRLETDEAIFTAMTNMYENKLNSDANKINALEKQLENTTDPDERARLQAEIDQLKKEKKMLEDKLSEGNTKLNEIRDRLEVEMASKNRGRPSEATGLELNFDESEISFDKQGYYSSSNPIPINVKLPEGLIYRIQIGMYSKQVKPETFQGLYPISGETIGDKVRYAAGMFDSYQKVTAIKNRVRDKGIGGAFVIAYYNGKKINVSRAIRMENE